MAHQSAANELTILAAAEEVGVRASNTEVINFIKSSQQMQTDGKFDESKYDAFVSTITRSMGMNTKDVEEAIRQTLTLQKINNYVMSNVVVTDGEVNEHFNNLYTKISAQVARFNSDDYKGDVLSSENILKEYFDKNKDSYMTAEQYKLVVAKFNYVAFEEDAKQTIGDGEVKSYYDSHKAEFKKGDKEQALDEVKATIITKLAKTKSKELASEKANLFANQVYDNIKDLDAIEEKNAAFVASYKEMTKGKLGTCDDVDWFENGASTIPKIGSEPSISTAASKIYTDIPVSDPVSGRRAAYVLFLKDKKEKGHSTFEMVQAKVMKDYTAEQSVVTARTAAKDFAAQFEAGTATDELKKKLKDLKPFSARELPEATVADRNAIAQLAQATANGNLSKIQNNSKGALAVFVQGRELPTAEEFEKNKEQMTTDFRSVKERAAMADFTAWIRKNSKY